MSPSNRKTLVIAMFATPVILCFIGMGALLNILVSSMHEEQVASAEAEKELQDAIAKNEELRDSLAEQEARAKQAREEKEKADRVAEEDRTNQEAAEDREKKTAKTEAGNADRRKQVSNEKHGTAQLPAVRQEHARLNISLEDLKKELQKAGDELKRLAAECDVARKSKDRERRQVDVTTLDGTRNVSHHKPVFVECTGDKAILHPQKRTLGVAPGTVDRETFLAVARGARHVVFLIRPDGFQCFDNYRESLLAVNKESQTPIAFGYEPVNADWELVFPGSEG